jgi:hypothetical protein
MMLLGDASVLTVVGETDLYTAPLFRRDLDETMDVTPGDVIVDHGPRARRLHGAGDHDGRREPHDDPAARARPGRHAVRSAPEGSRAPRELGTCIPQGPHHELCRRSTNPSCLVAGFVATPSGDHPKSHQPARKTRVAGAS